MTRISGDARVETGPLKIGDDWAGLFIRGSDTEDLTILLHILTKQDICPGFKEEARRWIDLCQATHESMGK